jgi:hypothetical protein
MGYKEQGQGQGEGAMAQDAPAESKNEQSIGDMEQQIGEVIPDGC